MSFYDSAFTRYIYPVSVYLFLQFPPIWIHFIFLSTNEKLLFLNRGELFYFSFCSVCPIVEPSLHSYVHNFFVSVSFGLLLVRACCSTSLECPSMFWALSLSSFIVFCPKGSCFSFHHCSRRPTWLYLSLPIFASRHSSFGKLPLGPPPLLHFVLGCSDLRFRRSTLSHFVILCLLTFRFSPRCRIVLFHSRLLSLRF